MKHAMSSRRPAAAIAIAALAAAAAVATAHTAGGTSPNAADRVRSAELARLRGAVDADRAAVGRLLAPDFQLIDVLGSPESRADYLANIGGRVDFLALTPLSPIRVRLYGTTAVARYQAAFEV